MIFFQNKTDKESYCGVQIFSPLVNRPDLSFLFYPPGRVEVGLDFKLSLPKKTLDYYEKKLNEFPKIEI